MYLLSEFPTFKGSFSYLRQFLTTESHLKMMKKVFFHPESTFCIQDI